jgi:integrase
VAPVLQPEEKKRLFVVARSNPNWTTVYAAALIAASTSARAADLRGLRWSDIDLFERVMTIPDSKSEAGERRLPLNPDAVLAYGILLERATKLGIAGSEFYIFPACENSRIDGTRPQKTWRTAWRNITRAAGLSIAGYVSRKMMEHYSHIRMEAKRKALEELSPGCFATLRRAPLLTCIRKRLMRQSWRPGATSLSQSRAIR